MSADQRMLFADVLLCKRLLNGSLAVSSDKAPDLSIEQKAFEAVFLELLPPGVTVSLSRDARGVYHAEYPRTAWELWQRARKWSMY